MRFLRQLWFALLGVFIVAGYTAAFGEPESYANKWEDAAGFTLVLLLFIGLIIYFTAGPRGKHE